MKKLLTIFILTLLAACSGKESESIEQKNILENLTYSVDTVVVDPGDEIINLQYGLNSFELSPDRKSLFIYDFQQTLFQKIDLEQMVLEGTYHFEKEGPNGIGRSFSFQVLSDEKLMIPAVPNSGIFNLQGELLTRINLKPEEIAGLGEINAFSILNELVLYPETGMLYSLPGDFLVGSRDLAKIDPENMQGVTIKLPEMEKAKNFRIYWNSETGGSIQTEYYSLKLFNNKLYITCTVGSGIYRYDPIIDSLEYVDFNHQIIPNEKTGEVLNEVSTEKDFWIEYRKVAGQISYRELMWDNQISRFYRFASKTILGETRQDPAAYEVYLLAYDKDLNLVGETLLEGFNQFPQSYFFKDGKLYSYVNVEDELGFAVFTFNF
ncbi:DUF4221 family protein [Algoriphagus aquimarinus]|uniref:DUF4221 family protein n=1 Tax=Algoriphagus aquimarinus TaxID=237018 RepID=UPI0030D796DB|tara:strand:- start:4232 stop:5368 length:1137 start_codon:yes stop_codon:yes gene_type:complete